MEEEDSKVTELETKISPCRIVALKLIPWLLSRDLFEMLPRITMSKVMCQHRYYMDHHSSSINLYAIAARNEQRKGRNNSTARKATPTCLHEHGSRIPRDGTRCPYDRWTADHSGMATSIGRHCLRIISRRRNPPNMNLRYCCTAAALTASGASAVVTSGRTNSMSA